jgi:hypothetical protein
VRLTREVPRERMQSIVFIALVVLVEAVWAGALVCLSLHFL